MAKSSKAEVQRRVHKIAEMLITGNGRKEIVRYSTENYFISERMVDKYLKNARELITKEVVKDLEHDFSIGIKRYELIFKLALDTKNFRLAMNTNKEITGLQGIKKIKIEHSGKVKNSHSSLLAPDGRELEQLSLDELDQLETQLREDLESALRG